MTKPSMKHLSAACLLALAPAVTWANITPVWQSTTAVSGGFNWLYNAQLSSDQDVRTGTAPAVTPVPQNNSGTGGFFTLNDFFGYISGTCAGPAGWTCTVQNLGYTPSSINTPDDPNIVNITWAHTSGPDILGQQASNAGTNLGDFTASTAYDLQDFVNYASRGWKNNGPAAGTIADNFGTTVGPMSLAVPEPGSLALMALALGAVGMVRRRARKPV